jgi:hypothetical protein
LIACSIAVFKGIFRPIFTMMDKESDPQSKKYAAIREGLTEVAALPLYAVTPWIAGKLADKLTGVTDEFAKKRIKTNAKFLGICAATLIIPVICNVIQPPIMNAIKKRGEAKKQNPNQDVAFKASIQEPQITNNDNKALNNPIVRPISYSNYNMKVGG